MKNSKRKVNLEIPVTPVNQTVQQGTSAQKAEQVARFSDIAIQERQLLIDFISSDRRPENFKFVKEVIDYAMFSIMQDPAEAHELIDPSGLNEFELLEAAKNFYVASRRDFIKHFCSVTDDFKLFDNPELENRITH